MRAPHSATPSWSSFMQGRSPSAATSLAVFASWLDAPGAYLQVTVSDDIAAHEAQTPG